MNPGQKQLLVVTHHQPTGDPYTLSSYPGPGVYLTSDHLSFVGSTVYTVPRHSVPPLLNPAPPQPPGISETTLLRAMAMCLNKPFVAEMEATPGVIAATAQPNHAPNCPNQPSF